MPVRSSRRTAPSTTAAASIGAPAAWALGNTGQGIGIALVDTGVSPRPELGDAVAGQVEVGAPGRSTDGHGHGTFLAGLIGADGGDGVPTGIAPDAHVVSFKVADADGRTSIEAVVSALGVVRATAEELGIRVVVLALGGPADEVADPVEEALEDLWASGLVVVVASGNEPDEVTEPGVSPYLLTAGATDDHGTADRSDDVEAEWSGRGVDRLGRPKPDVHAPGTSVVSVRVPGSLADREHPGSRIGGHAFRGSGTSMAAAITAGAAALVLRADPTLTPDEVKGRLMASAEPSSDNPAGTIDVPAAIAADEAVANTDLPPLEPAMPTRPVPGDGRTAVPVASRWTRPGKGRSWIGSSWIGSSWIGSVWIGPLVDRVVVDRVVLGRLVVDRVVLDRPDWVGLVVDRLVVDRRRIVGRALRSLGRPLLAVDHCRDLTDRAPRVRGREDRRGTPPRLSLRSYVVALVRSRGSLAVTSVLLVVDPGGVGAPRWSCCWSSPPRPRHCP